MNDKTLYHVSRSGELMDWTSSVLPQKDDHLLKVKSEDQIETELKNIIRALNVKVTQQRMVILRTLRDGHRHITAQELFEKIVKVDPTLGFATVYRFLRTLTEHRFVTEVRMGGLPARYELAPKEHHDHLTCTQCGKICEFENQMIEDIQVKIAQKFGFTLTHHVLELYGTCRECQNEIKKPN